MEKIALSGDNILFSSSSLLLTSHFFSPILTPWHVANKAVEIKKVDPFWSWRSEIHSHYFINAVLKLNKYWARIYLNCTSTVEVLVATEENYFREAVS